MWMDKIRLVLYHSKKQEFWKVKQSILAKIFYNSDYEYGESTVNEVPSLKWSGRGVRKVNGDQVNYTFTTTIRNLSQM